MDYRGFQKEAKRYTKADGSTDWEKLEASEESGPLILARVILGPQAGATFSIEPRGECFVGRYRSKEANQDKPLSQAKAKKIAAAMRKESKFEILFDRGII